MSTKDEAFFSTAMAVGKGIDHLSGAERIATLSQIKNEQGRYKILLMYQASEMFPFLKDAADKLLQLNVSDNNARGRAGIEKVLSAQVASDRLSMKDRLMGFIGRGEV
jgi:hypothetical protein